MNLEQFSTPNPSLIKIGEGWNVSQALQELELHEELWNLHPFRKTYHGSSHKEVDDIWIRYNAIKESTTIEDFYNGLEMVNYPAFHLLPECVVLALELSEKVKGSQLGRVIVANLPAGKSISAHRDEGKTCTWYDRFHIVLKEGGWFKVGEETVKMKTGEVWWFDNQQEHAVVNASSHDRIHLIVDVKLGNGSPLAQMKQH